MPTTRTASSRSGRRSKARSKAAAPSAPATRPATFDSLGVDADLVADLDARGFAAPFPIQAATLPDTLAGRDVLGRGRTGSGKTLAFALPLVQRLAEEDMARAGHPIGLVLAPTRELALQIAETIRPLADALELSVTTVFGGVSQRPQEKALAGGVDIVVACPGRLLDLMGQGVVSLDEVSVTVLDEADHMADLGFLPGVRRIMRATPARGQRLLFSATLDGGVDRIVDEFLHDPLQHAVDPSTSPVDAMDHRVWMVADKAAKDGVVRRLASGTGQRILFTRTKHLARRLARKLTRDGVPAVELQGNMSQNARERAMRATPARGQRLLFSATLDGGVDRIVDEFLHDPLQHAVDPSTSPVDAMDHRVWMVADKAAKDGVVRRLASGTGQRILFTRTKHLARRLARKLTRDGVPAVELQGNMSQNARERAMRAFSTGQAHVMVATDIAARGIDISGVELVVHVDPPAEHKAYLHRSGRTARAGAAGVVVTLVLPEQKEDVRALLRKAGIRAGIERIRPDDDAVTALVGQVAPVVAAEDMPEGVAVKGGGPAGRASAEQSGRGTRPRYGRGPSGGRRGQQSGRQTGRRDDRRSDRQGGQHGGRRTGDGGRGRGRRTASRAA